MKYEFIGFYLFLSVAAICYTILKLNNIEVF